MGEIAMRPSPERRGDRARARSGFRTLPAGVLARERAVSLPPNARHPEPEIELAEMLASELGPGTVIAAMSPAGLTIARSVAETLALPLSYAPVVPLSPPWNAEPVYGAVAFDGSVHLDDDLLHDLEIGRRDLERAVTGARAALSAEPHRDPVELARRGAAIVDDGRAPAIVVAAAAAALRNAGADRVLVAVASSSCRHLRRLARDTDRVLCPHEYHAA